MTTAIESVKYLQPGEGKGLSVVGEIITLKLTGEDTGGSFSVFEDVTPPHGGPPQHVHHREDESFYVLDGVFEFIIGNRVVRAGPGTTLFAPRDVPHSFQNLGEEAGVTLTIASPAGFEKFFEEADRRLQPGTNSIEHLVELGRKYGLEFLSPADEAPGGYVDG